jgi:hypothetical protein
LAEKDFLQEYIQQVAVEAKPECPVRTRGVLADGSEPIVDNPSPGYSVTVANHGKIVGVEYTTGDGSSAGKAQQVIAPSRDNPLAARHERTFSKTLLYEK